ncbi:MAG: ORF6N domain-containing protein [Ruminococcus sp.]|nr:ORF6N domain-containing protein [Ruminococcus sp.]
MYELINGTPMPVREYNGQRVVTFRDIDSVHQRPDGTARKRFNDNRKHFIENVDFFKVCADEIRTHKIIELSPKAHEDITLVTLSGYLMIAKSFTDDLSWSVQRLLVTYFTAREQVGNYSLVIRNPEMKVKKYPPDILPDGLF